MSEDPPEAPSPGSAEWFRTTHWSLVLTARDDEGAQKRGGGRQIVSWDECNLEEQHLGALEGLNAGDAFDRRWAMLARAQDRLQTEYAQRLSSPCI
jgi:hypothetical protein